MILKIYDIKKNLLQDLDLSTYSNDIGFDFKLLPTQTTVDATLNLYFHNITQIQIFNLYQLLKNDEQILNYYYLTLINNDEIVFNSELFLMHLKDCGIIINENIDSSVDYLDCVKLTFECQLNS